ncbi:hypothetical protein [Streptomyces formicae]|uniref:Uncharacterized protein n=1 Tax=Streptomyces formicae TaxID=1616117 RepID=A0ABY3WVF8_9ACTN|nr:hypothetical protein [Streptomyces formicae]UNM15521.1 hypothetical protein J4032_32260 [Streptomyces formicae]
MVTPSHASPRTGASPTGDIDTGEVRVPLELFALDSSLGHVDLVLSRPETERLHAALSYQMLRTDNSGRRLLPEAV